VLAATHAPRPGNRATATPHAIVRVPDLGTRACASCHEFAFPGAEHEGERGLMQSTATEHARAEADVAAQTCSDCHMRGDRASHAFTISRDADALSRAVDVIAERTPEGALRFTLSTRGVGHAFPTGDLFRRLVLRVHAPHRVIERAFERTFRSERGPDRRPVRSTATDTRVLGTRVVDLSIDSKAPIAWELVYQRVTSVDRSPPFRAEVEAELPLHAGTL
jgi:hypothetical protein